MTIMEVDLLDEASASISADSFTITRAFMLTDFGAMSRSGKVASALFADGIPRAGEEHPDTNLLIVINVAAKPIEPDVIKVIVTYGYPKQEDKPPDEAGQMEVEVSSTLQEVVTNFDADGNLITVEYTKKIVDEKTGDIKEEKDKQTGEIKKQVPLTVLKLTRKEPFDPRLKSQLYTGKVNKSPIFDDPARFWLIKFLGGNSKDGQKSFDVSYEFQRNPNTWQTTVIYIDPETGKPPTDIADEEGRVIQPNAVKQVKAYEEIEFRDLNIVAPSRGRR